MKNYVYTEYQIAPCVDIYLDDEYFLELFRKMLIIYGINKSYTSLDLQHMIGKVVYVFYSMEYFENQDRLFLKSNKNRCLQKKAVTIVIFNFIAHSLIVSPLFKRLKYS